MPKINKIGRFCLSRDIAKEANSILKSPDGTLVRCLYVTNVPAKIGREQLISFFSKYGTVKLLRFEKHNHTKKSTYAFVTFETPEEATSLYMNRYFLKLMGFKLYVNIADSWHQPTVHSDGSIIYDPVKQAKGEQILSLLKKIMSETTDEDDCDDMEGETVINTIEDCPIYKLNDDCLRHIFDFIDFSDRYVISHVCRRWRNLMESFWSKFTCLNFTEAPFNSVLKPKTHLGMYLRLCPNISSVHLIDQYNLIGCYSVSSFNSQSIVQVATFCPKLEELIIEGIELDIRPLASVAHFCENLKSFTMIDCKFKDRDNEMSPMMKKCKKLESLKFVNCVFNPGHWLKFLPPGLKSLFFSACSFINDYLYLGLQNVRESLETFVCIIDICNDPLNFNHLSKFSQLRNITYVSIVTQLSNNFPCFQRLNSLQIECNNIITDTLLKELVEASPQLTILNLSNSQKTLSSDGLKAITNLPNLIKLNLSKTLVTDDLLIALADNNKNLEVISLIRCSVSNAGCKSLVQNLMKLKDIYLCNCTNVTNVTVEASVEAASLNFDKANLTIYVYGSGIKEVQTKPHERVELNFDSLNWSWTQFEIANFFNDDDDEDENDDSFNYDFEDDEDDFLFGFPNDYDYDSDDYELDYDDLCDLALLNNFN